MKDKRITLVCIDFEPVNPLTPEEMDEWPGGLYNPCDPEGMREIIREHKEMQKRLGLAAKWLPQPE